MASSPPFDTDDTTLYSNSNVRSSSYGQNQSSQTPAPNSSDLDGILKGLRHRHSRATRSSEPESGSEDLKRLQKLWIAERFAPDILPFDEPLITRIIERIRQQVGKLMCN